MKELTLAKFSLNKSPAAAYQLNLLLTHDQVFSILLQTVFESSKSVVVWQSKESRAICLALICPVFSSIKRGFTQRSIIVQPYFYSLVFLKEGGGGIICRGPMDLGLQTRGTGTFVSKISKYMLDL